MQVVTLVHEENGAFGASFPDFPGCTTVAGNLDAVMAKAVEVLAFHVEGMMDDGEELPRLRTLSELRGDLEFVQDFEGAIVALTPFNPPTQAVRVNITLDESLLTRIDRVAEQSGETRSGFLAAAAKARLAR